MFEIDFMETISSSDEDRYHAFKNYLINKVSAKTKKTGIKKANIAKECDLAKNDFDKKRYSNLKSDKLSKIVRTYQFSIAETVDLYYRLGRCLNINNKFDKSIIGDQKIPENLCDRIGNELFIDCLFDLIKKEHVHSLCKKEKTEKIIELINIGKKEEAYSLIIFRPFDLFYDLTVSFNIYIFLLLFIVIGHIQILSYALLISAPQSYNSPHSLRDCAIVLRLILCTLTSLSQQSLFHLQCQEYHR